MKETCSVTQDSTPAPDAEDAPDSTENAPPVDQHEVDTRAAQQLLPAIVRLATRRLGAPECEAAHALGDVEDA